MWVQGLNDHGQGSRQVLWEPKPLIEQISGTWARAQPVSELDGESGGSRLQLSPSHMCDDIRQVTKLQTFLGDFPGDNSGWESTCQCRGHRLDPWQPGGGINIPHASECLSLCITAREALCCNRRFHMKQEDPVCCK